MNLGTKWGISFVYLILCFFFYNFKLFWVSVWGKTERNPANEKTTGRDIPICSISRRIWLLNVSVANDIWAFLDCTCIFNASMITKFPQNLRKMNTRSQKIPMGSLISTLYPRNKPKTLKVVARNLLMHSQMRYRSF